MVTEVEMDALTQQLKKRLGLIKHFATLGDSSDLSAAVVDEPGRRGWVRVRIENSDTPYTVVKSGLLGAYSPNPGSPVVVGYDEKGDLAIEKADFDAIVEANGNPAILNSGNPAMSAFNQTDGLLPLFCGAVSGTQGTLTNEVFINSWRFVSWEVVKWYQGSLVDLTALVPAANLHRYIVIFLKIDDLTIEIGSSTAIATITPLQESDKQECYSGRSNETIPIALWRLHDAQTVVTNADKIEDLRPWLSPFDALGRISKNNIAAVPPNPAVDDVTLGYTVGSHWYDTTANNWYVCIDNTDGAAIWQKPVITTPATAAQNTIVPTADVVALTTRGHAAATANIEETQVSSASTLVRWITGIGAAIFQNFTDSTTAFQILKKAGGTPIFNLDTTNERVGIGTAAPATKLHTAGAITIDELSADPADPAEGSAVFWKSDGVATGDDGDLLYMEQSGGVVDTGSLKWKDSVPSSVTLNTGTSSSNITDAQVMFDGNTYDVSEVTGVPGYDVEFNFSGIDRCPTLVACRWQYDGGATPHYVTIDIYNYTTVAWDQLRVFNNSNAYFDSMTMYLPLVNQVDYVSGGAAMVRFYHQTSGSGGHSLHVDYVGITHSLQNIL